MKNITKLTALAVAVALSPPVYAVSQADLIVAGSIAPAPCTIVIAGGKDFRFGTLMSDELNSDVQTHYISSKTVTVNCPSPTGLLLSFPFDNGGQLQPHGGSTATGSLSWWIPSMNSHADVGCANELHESERIKVDAGDGNLVLSTKFLRLFRGKVIVQSCPQDSFYSGGNQGNGAEDGHYTGHPTVKSLHVPLNLRMSIHPRDELNTSGAIQLVGSASIVMNYF